MVILESKAARILNAVWSEVEPSNIPMLDSITSQKQDLPVLGHWHSGLAYPESNIQTLTQLQSPPSFTMLWWVNI